MGAPINKDGTPKVLEHAHTFYSALTDQAKLEPVADNTPGSPEPVKELLVFRGKLQDVWAAAGISQAYYSNIRKLLRENGCITVVQQGTRNVPTIMVLNHPPPEGAKIPEEPLTARPTFAILDRRVEALESWRDTFAGGINIAEALRNMELRIASLEAANGRKGENGKAES